MSGRDKQDDGHSFDDMLSDFGLDHLKGRMWQTDEAAEEANRKEREKQGGEL